ncbi:F-box/LRR-repeat protein [Vitis vinifera]|uniref:F-box/LRR-repeat protein n=1 Tax=Vitis vinifera TaxID=29760 RepID=A0A438DDL0_VITVI|nr:F-box/LRR-repeat protein [Vitis vinifera]
MEHLPVEVIGNILSRLGAARDIVIASATCRKWREAFCYHLHTLSFNSKDWPLYHDLTTSQLEILITETIFQTTGLQGLSILMDEVDEFSASMVIAWLMQKLETLFLAHNLIMGVEPNYQRFSCLKSLSLSSVSISALDMSLLLTACPKIEILDLVNLEIAMSDTQVAVELRSPTLKSIYVEEISLDKFILEADGLEHLHLKDCVLELFELVGKGTLKQYKIDDVSFIHFDIGESLENLEVVDINNFTIIWPKFYKMILRSSKLRRLRLWDVFFDDEDEILDLETIAVCFPQLSYLSLRYDLRDRVLHYGLQGSSHLENVIEMELGWTDINELFLDWAEGLLQRCPNLRKLVIHEVISEIKTHEEYQMLGNFTSSIVQLMRKYMHVEVQFYYE